MITNIIDKNLMLLVYKHSEFTIVLFKVLFTLKVLLKYRCFFTYLT